MLDFGSPRVHALRDGRLERNTEVFRHPLL